MVAAPADQEESPAKEKVQDSTPPATVLSERRKALFEPLKPIDNHSRKRPSNESLLPPPDFESTTYPKGWLIGKKRKLVNVDVVETMRRIAIQEMNQKVPLFVLSRVVMFMLDRYLYRISQTFQIWCIIVLYFHRPGKMTYTRLL